MFSISDMHMSVMVFRAADKKSRGLNLSGLAAKNSRTAAVNPMRKSLSTLILQIFICVARRSCCVSMPRAFFMSPPYSFIFVTIFCGMFEAPCKTNGKFGIRDAISAKISNRSSVSSVARLYAP